MSLLYASNSKMWFEDQVVFPRFLRTFFWTILIQQVYLSVIVLLLKIIWDPISGFLEWILYVMHWKTLLYQAMLSMTTVVFGTLNRRFYAVEKNIDSTRLEKICRALSPHRVQHFLLTAFLGGLVSYCCIGLFANLDPEKISSLSYVLVLESDLEHFFVIQHGCYTGILFSLKYFICTLYLVKFTLHQETKQQHVRHQITFLLKDSSICVLKSIHWYYILFIIVGPIVESSVLSIGITLSTTSASENLSNLLYGMINIKLFLVSFITGVVIFFNWSLYLTIFNAFATEPHVFAIEVPVKSDISKSLISALSSQSEILKHLGVLDLRLLSQHDPIRRQQIFAISHPGGHPHQWNAVSDLCISSLKSFVNKLLEYSVMIAGKESKVLLNNEGVTLNRHINFPKQIPPKVSENVCGYLRGLPAVAYFFDELPSTKIRQLFASSQPLIWMTEALGYLVSASYTEDKFGVIQQTLPTIICLLLDIKMAEEKLPIDLVSIRTYVTDPQGRYEHIHQRVALKNAVNSSLCRIANTFKDDINGIYLPEEYHLYFQRYLHRKNI